MNKNASGMERVHVQMRPGAQSYDSSRKIIEFSDDCGNGGLISFQPQDDGTLRVEVYRVDPMVTIVTPTPTGTAQWAETVHNEINGPVGGSVVQAGTLPGVDLR